MSTDTPDVIFRARFDHGTDEALFTDIVGEWDRLREESRVFRSDAYPWDIWYLMRFDDVFDGFRDHERFSSRQTNYNVEDSHRWIPAQVDPPEHTPYRTAINPLFSPSAVASLEPDVRALCVELIEQFASDGRCDMVDQFARRFPTTIFMKMVGLPVEESDTFLAWASALMHTPGADAQASQIRKDASRTIYRYLAKHIDDHKTSDADDVVTALLRVQIAGRPITDAELLEICFLLYVAGMDTVAGLMSYVIKHLAEHPEQRRLLRERPDMIPGAVEEFLRFYAIASPARVVKADVDFAGCPMKRGDRLVLATWPANRDPRQFERADEFIIDRSPNRHSAFGVGVHRCVGSHLARLELRVAIEEWLRLVPEFEIPADVVVTQHVAGAAGLDHLPLVW